LRVSAFLIALAVAAIPQSAPPTPETPAGPVLGAAAIDAARKQSIADGTIDRLIQGLEVPGSRTAVAMLHRTRPEPSALIHQRVTEIYQVIEGSGTIVTGGRLSNPTPNDLTRVWAGPSLTGVHEGGESRRVGPNDVIIVPAGTPHRFSQLDGPISYLVYRFESGAAAPK